MPNLKNPARILQSFQPATSGELGSQMCPAAAAIGSTAAEVAAQLVILSVPSSPRSAAPPHRHSSFMSWKEHPGLVFLFSPLTSFISATEKAGDLSVCSVWKFHLPRWPRDHFRVGVVTGQALSVPKRFFYLDLNFRPGTSLSARQETKQTC